ncbi:RdgB/HAM1 family non-canonical purine NTP pyrophosphatase [Glaciecola sp. MH2013]|uniref:RdgB/HAM1 family non-canonical purine NTP pyrophosphatase n=1 Tax=Glaciecola sp. MH2013 TaxID=2785524 RepID=UPI00189E0642|nr:RdgB/HAM1 family non-canonical purine NTP pyrophosphatase [Glaciecola sp. MH2013]MBF7074836.1 RdgB/HAM1 family non-canonical purine NTP pyrophosphatase [Glaciecola sp. MH2013]
MTTSNSIKHIVLATGNKGKVAEFTSLFEQYSVKISPQSEFDVAEVPETGTTFVENAIIKARHAAKVTGLPAIADDSGLAVNALGGAPGIYSSRYAGEGATDSSNIDKLLGALDEKRAVGDLRSARFLCVLVFMEHELDPTPLICQGEWHGVISTTRHGDGGFGYDPVFWLPEQNCSAAQLDKSTKNAVSHRGKALVQLMEKMRSLM